MSARMRPIREVWFTDTALFLDHDDVTEVLAHLATVSGSSYDEDTYLDKSSFWIEDGEAFLNYIEKDENLTVDTVADQVSQNSTELDPVGLASFLNNLRALAPEWRAALDPQDKSLRFYID